MTFHNGAIMKVIHAYSVCSGFFLVLPRPKLRSQKYVPPFYLPGEMKVTSMTFYHYLLNGISFFCFMGHFLKMPLKQNFPFPHIALQCICGEGGWGIFPFFLQPSCTKNVLFFWSRALPFRQMGGSHKRNLGNPKAML